MADIISIRPETEDIVRHSRTAIEAVAATLAGLREAGVPAHVLAATLHSATVLAFVDVAKDTRHMHALAVTMGGALTAEMCDAWAQQNAALPN